MPLDCTTVPATWWICRFPVVNTVQLNRGVHSKKSSCTPKKKSEKSEKNPKNPRIFFLGFKIRIHYLGVNHPSISAFKSFFIHKVRKKNRKNPKKSQKTKRFNKSKDFFFDDLKSGYIIWEWTTPRTKPWKISGWNEWLLFWLVDPSHPSKIRFWKLLRNHYRTVQSLDIWKIWLTFRLVS